MISTMMRNLINSKLFRTSLGASLAVLLGCCFEAHALPLDLDQPEDALQAFRKVLCSVEDNQTVYFAWIGEVYSRVPGERDRHLFNVQGVSTRSCVSLESETGSLGFRQVSREVMLYLDPETNALLEQWENPWTGKINTVVPVANDPVNSSPFWAETTGQQLQFQHIGETDTLFLSAVIPLFYPNPLGGDYQDFVGGHYHAIEIFNFSVNRTELLDSDGEDLDHVIAIWNRVAPWLPWMEMGNRPGEMIFQAVSTQINDWQELPQPLRDQIATQFALYQNPPPPDDDRPNQTTWTNFQQYLESQP